MIDDDLVETEKLHEKLTWEEFNSTHIEKVEVASGNCKWESEAGHTAAL